MAIIRHIPNCITLLNLISGCIATYYAFNGRFSLTLLFIFAAALFDFCDGLAARLLHAPSPVGKELDSLADVVSFGVAPSAEIFALLSLSEFPALRFGGFVLAAFSALRLARFNLDERQTNSFIGLPVPADALFWAGLAFAYSEKAIQFPCLLLALTLLFSALLVCRLPMFSLKVKGLAWRENRVQYIFLLGCALLLIFFRINAIMWCVVWYLLFSLVLKLFFSEKNSQS